MRLRNKMSDGDQYIFANRLVDINIDKKLDKLYYKYSNLGESAKFFYNKNVKPLIVKGKRLLENIA